MHLIFITIIPIKRGTLHAACLHSTVVYMSRLVVQTILSVVLLAIGGCASTTKPKMGTISDLSRVKGDAPFCEHKVPEQVCTKHHPELIASFKKVDDWCGMHEVPESQCLICHPELTFEALPDLPPDADLKIIVKQGEDLDNLATVVVAGKVTVFDFYADWCAGCREIDLHMYKMLAQRKDVAVRKINVVDWDSAIAKRYLKTIKGLPHVIVYGADGKEVKAINGVKLAELDAAITAAAATVAAAGRP
jgi:thiol-disulfide isomerase/thioredoxin